MGHYELGKEYFIKARVADIGHDGQYPLRVLVPVNTPLTSDYTSINMANVPGLLLTAEEVVASHNRDIANLERAVEELRVENESFRKQIDEHKKLFEENGKVAMDLATQRDNFKKHLETALKDFAEKDKACTDALRDKADLQKALEALNKDIDGYRATIQKMASVIGFLCGTEGGQDDKI